MASSNNNAHANQNGSGIEKVWLEIRSSEQQKEVENEQQENNNKEAAINDSLSVSGANINATTNSAVSQSTDSSFAIDARVPVNV